MNSRRLVHVDYLRSFIILLVAVFHISVTFMDRAPIWWYVKSPDSSILFTLLVIILDTFMMPLMFFIAGFVLLFQLKKVSVSTYIFKRLKRLGVPWICCTLLFSPYLSFLIAHETGNDIPYISMVTHYFWTDYYSQGPYWFLGILLSFTLLVLLVRRIFDNRFSLENVSAGTIWFMVFIMSFAGYSIGSYFTGADEWLNPLYIWSFQPSRIVTYFSFFIAGYLLSLKEWKFSIHSAGWAITALVTAAGFVVMKGRVEETQSPASFLILGFFYAGLTLSLSLFFLGFFKTVFNKSSSILTFITRHSFTVYLVHLPIEAWIADRILAVPAGICLRWFLLLTVVLVSSTAVSMLIQTVSHKVKPFINSG